MLLILVVSILALTNALQPADNVELASDNIRDIISNYISNISDVQEKYVVDERLSKVITHYFKGKISSFPLYKISLKIDRNPVKIPWTLGEPYEEKKNKPRFRTQDERIQKRYKYARLNENKTEKFTTKLDKENATKLTETSAESKDFGTTFSSATSTTDPTINTTL